MSSFGSLVALLVVAVQAAAAGQEVPVTEPAPLRGSASPGYVFVAGFDPSDDITRIHLRNLLRRAKIPYELRREWVVYTPAAHRLRVRDLLAEDARERGYALAWEEESIPEYVPRRAQTTGMDATYLYAAPSERRRLAGDAEYRGIPVAPLISHDATKRFSKRYPYVTGVRVAPRPYIDSHGREQTGYYVWLRLSGIIRREISDTQLAFLLWDGNRVSFQGETNDWPEAGIQRDPFTPGPIQKLPSCGAANPQ
jgi:hypothetical protein